MGGVIDVVVDEVGDVGGVLLEVTGEVGELCDEEMLGTNETWVGRGP